MIPVLTIAQMRAIDKAAIAGNITRGYSYMERAGAGLCAAAREMMPDPKAGKIAVVCGKGNNGGDGYVAATLLMNAGYDTSCFSLCRPEELSGEVRLAFDGYAACNGNVVPVGSADDLDSLRNFRLIIDAILGTGIRGNPRGLAAEAITAINETGIAVLAADTPSGLDNDTGAVADPCIRATVTVAMGFPKIGAYFYPGRTNTGRLTVCDLGYPGDIVDRMRSNVGYPTLEALRRMLPPRKPAGSKHDHGQCLMVCGARGMTGAARLASLAALRTGCGMVHLFPPESIIDVLAAKLDEVVLHPGPQTADGTLGLAAYDQIMEASSRMQCLCIGPGISCNPETTALVRRLVAEVKIPVVLDADGINAFRDHVPELKKHASALVMTPHGGEWARLFGELPADPAVSFAALATRAAEFDMTVLYKGSPSRSAQPGGTCAVLPYGNSGMATAGSGDVLAGIMASLIAQGCATGDAAILGAFLHGKAGDFASGELGEYSMIASDIIRHIHEAVKLLTP